MPTSLWSRVLGVAFVGAFGCNGGPAPPVLDSGAMDLGVTDLGAETSMAPGDVPLDGATGDGAPTDSPPSSTARMFRGQPLGMPDRTLQDVDAVGYDLDLALDDASPGMETYRATLLGVFIATRALTELSLDLEGNELDGVTVDGVEARATRAGDRLTVALPSPVSDGQGFVVTTRYHGSFRQSRGSSSGFNTNGGLLALQQTASRTRMFMSLDWPTRARRWLPVRDHPRDGAMVAVRATFPEGYTVVANGRLVSNTPVPGGLRAWQYEALTPMPVYDLHLAAFEGWRDTALPPAANGVAIHHLAYAASAANSARIYADAPAMMDFYTAQFGPYRWGTMSYLQEPAIGGGMEHATVVSMDESLYANVPVAREVAIHELAHHWNGNLVRIGTWNDLWLSEGFCDYFTARFIEDHDGAEAGRRGWEKLLRLGLQAEHTPASAAVLPLRAADPERGPLEVFTSIVYKKGAWAVRMLELTLGREALTRFLRGWFDRHAFGHVTTAMLQQELQRETGRDLTAFFDQWVYAPFHPALTVDMTPEDSGAMVTVQQAQPRGPGGGFQVAVPVAFTNGSATQRVTVNLRGMRTTERVSLPFRPTGFTVDPDLTLYATTTCDASHRCRLGWTCRAFTGSGLSLCLPP
ncbi:MAG: M1 family metallopeptidase [Deltaproteobacteria bacterium]|nr:M1 family metallopeptidase [Deltaproteobacteria bacterium]